MPGGIRTFAWRKGTPLADRCLYQKDLARARKAHVVVINHALFFAGLPLKEADALILDEAHTLEDAASRFLGYELSNLSLKRLWDDLFSPETGRGLARRLGKGRTAGARTGGERGARSGRRIFFCFEFSGRFGRGNLQRRMRVPLEGTGPLAGALASVETLLVEELAASGIQRRRSGSSRPSFAGPGGVDPFEIVRPNPP